MQQLTHTGCLSPSLAAVGGCMYVSVCLCVYVRVCTSVARIWTMHTNRRKTRRRRETRLSLVPWTPVTFSTSPKAAKALAPLPRNRRRAPRLPLPAHRPQTRVMPTTRVHSRCSRQRSLRLPQSPAPPNQRSVPALRRVTNRPPLTRSLGFIFSSFQHGGQHTVVEWLGYPDVIALNCVIGQGHARGPAP